MELDVSAAAAEKAEYEKKVEEAKEKALQEMDQAREKIEKAEK